MCHYSLHLELIGCQVPVPFLVLTQIFCRSYAAISQTFNMVCHIIKVDSDGSNFMKLDRFDANLIEFIDHINWMAILFVGLLTI